MAPRKAPPQPKVFAEAYAEHRAPKVSPLAFYEVAGRHAVFDHLPGETIELPTHIAMSLVASGNLIPAESPDPQGEPDPVVEPGQLPDLNESE